MQNSYRKPKAAAPAPKHEPEDERVRKLELPNFSMRMLNASLLLTGQGYQRPVSMHNVKCIKDGYIKELVNPIKVSMRNGKYYVFDGQHTLTVLMELFGENCAVPCLIYAGMDYDNEAMLFARQDEFKKKLSITEVVRAEYEGNDQAAVEFYNAVEGCGFNITRKRSHDASSFGNIGYLYNTIYKKNGVDHLKKVLSIIKSAWPEEKGATDSAIVQGIDVFIRLYDGEYDLSNLVEKLRKVSPVVIIRNGKADMTHNGATRYAVQVFDQYNKGKKSKLRSKF